MKKNDTPSKQTIPALMRKKIGLLCLAAMLLNLSGVWAQCSNTTVLSITGPQTSTWTAPTGGPFAVRINASGAAGGAYLEANPDRVGGTGATMSGTFVVQSGEILRAIAGGGGNNSQLEGGGAGGGSGAVNCGVPPDVCADGIVLIIAAGGNGGQLGGPTDGYGLGGSAATNGDGEGGQISFNNDSGGGGGGLNSDGETAISGGQGGKKVNMNGLAAGGLGSSNMMSNPPSGFNHGGAGMAGGGGGGDGGTQGVDNAAGGGGGHSGGDGGNESAATSFNSGDDPADADGTTGGAISGVPSAPANPGTVSFVCLGALPVTLINFKAIIQSTRVHLHWSTAVEKNNRGYDVERSADGRHWSALGFVPGSGNTTTRRDYSFTDENPYAGINYYRLKQMDTDGKFEYSPMVVADVRATAQQFEVFPNPSTTGELSIRIVNKTEGDALLEIFDWAGYKVWKEKIHLVEGTLVWPVSMTTYPKGAYTARLELPGGQMQFKKILLQ